MKEIKIILIVIIIVSFKLLFAQNITFSPETDTIKIIDGCTGPEIICKVNPGIQYDTVLISPGFNTDFSYYDTLYQWLSIQSCYFLIKDSLHQYDYELWYNPLGTLPYFQQVPFDSAFLCYDYIFELQLLAKFKENHVDSLSQLIITEYGLEVEEFPLNKYSSFELYANYPNPFNTETNIKYYLSKNSEVVLSIYDIKGAIGSNIIKWQTVKWFPYLSVENRSFKLWCVLFIFNI